MSTTLSIEPLIYHGRREASKRTLGSKRLAHCSFSHPKNSVFHGRRFFCNFKPPSRPLVVRASASTETAMAETFESCDLVFSETFPLKQTTTVEGKIFIKLGDVKDGINRKVSIGCDLPGKWILHWGVSYIGDVGNEWDQPPKEMIPLESIRIKDYAIETPLKTSSSSSGGDTIQEVEIDFDPKSTIAAINFVLKDEETGAWYQHKGRDFKVPLVNGQKKGSTKWPGPLGQLSSMFLKTKALGSEDEAGEPGQDNSPVEGFQEELPIVKEVAVCNSVTVTVRKCPDTANSLLYMETDLPGNVIIHWGVCRDDANKWEIPDSTPPYTLVFKDKALRTLLQAKEGGNGSSGFFTLDEKFKGFLFVLKQDENTWLNCMGNDFYVPLLSSGIFTAVPKGDQSEKENSSISTVVPKDDQSEKKMAPKKSAKVNKSSLSDYANGVLNEIRNLVTDISDKKIQTAKNKAAQEEVLREIEKLAAEAYSIFRRSTVSTPPKEMELVVDSEDLSPPITSLGIGTGFEILCQGFNWESHKSGRWYMDIKEKAKELSSLGFTTIWLPPPTESVSPEGYMPKDLYSLNSRYGSMDELKEVVRTFREVGMKVLGDVVLNHRCAHYQNENGVWNKFGGRLNWDDRAIVADDPHFQGRGNKSSGDNFHAAPNIDHSQDFVRKDIKEWLCWLRKEIGYDGWRLDFVRGFWGGYVKDYIEATQPYFAVGEYWDSLNYTYGEMDHNQDAHRQRIVDWINATDGKACAFDVTTKGVLHTALGKCEYWRLSDEQGKPPGVMGWWPSRAVTFIENHDTGSTQGHWRFPSGKEMQGYAYILTHPGTPSVFYDHIFSDYQSEIAALISIRNRNKINSRSSVKITKTERDVYAAIINDRVAVKIGPGHYEPHSAGQIWIQALEGRDYKVWVASS